MRFIICLFVGSVLFWSCQRQEAEPGTANVQYSPWTPVTFTKIGGGMRATIPAPPITQEVLDKADIRVYMKLYGVVISLPYAMTIGSSTSTLLPEFDLGNITLHASQAIAPTEFRYVIIRGGVSTARRSAEAKLDYNDYEAVQRAFNIPD